MGIDRKKRFEAMKAAYARLEEEKQEHKEPLIFKTGKGIFGAMPCERAFTFFERIGLWKYSRFIDIGSGDGRVVLIASLFTNAEGIEIDEGLCADAMHIRDALDIGESHAKIICKDIVDHDFSSYDILFINPDKGWHKGLEEKLLHEMRDDAVLYVNNDIFLPERIKKGPKIWIDQIPIIEYRKGWQTLGHGFLRAKEIHRQKSVRHNC